MRRSYRAITVIVLALLVAGAAMAGWEWFWRTQGYEPALYDDRDLWSLHRDRVSGGDQSRHFAVIGASRIQLAFSTAAFESSMPGWRATSLAINGHYPTAVLEDLAADEDFSGVLLVAVDARGLAHWYRDMSEPWVRHYHRDFGPQRRIERHLLTALQKRLVVVGSEFNLVRRLTGWLDDRPPPRHYTRLLDDRTITADYGQADVEGLRRHFAQGLATDYEQRPAPPPERWRSDLAPISEAVSAIQARGGTVVFLRMPTSDRHWELDSENYPRDRYWDRLSEATGARSIHFADHPELAGLELPDTSHIDGSDRARFTRSLVAILVRAGVLPDAE
ncbi:hypothetical protein [Wenzhouxiangella sediminis]|uniref:Uncharacterized protein n=1 Tax=Wenzhouxiangella sediminis TaxID=1792836 RepID=A0A3E1K9X1_9GAMM|nr:hypothetical protein [Wenzhouxiangella sediminis]RFF31009.1 hypothetical protein DZC52_06130 [Wenzhouxiangella sediminis]